jgi:hypothetical protein
MSHCRRPPHVLRHQPPSAPVPTRCHSRRPPCEPRDAAPPSATLPYSHQSRKRFCSPPQGRARHRPRPTPAPRACRGGVPRAAPGWGGGAERAGGDGRGRAGAYEVSGGVPVLRVSEGAVVRGGRVGLLGYPRPWLHDQSDTKTCAAQHGHERVDAEPVDPAAHEVADARLTDTEHGRCLGLRQPARRDHLAELDRRERVLREARRSGSLAGRDTGSGVKSQ